MDYKKIAYYILKAFIYPVLSKLEKVIVPVLVHQTVEFVESEMAGESGKIKRDYVVDFVMANIKLPLLARPFKFIIKSQIEATIDEYIEDSVKVMKAKIQ